MKILMNAIRIQNTRYRSYLMIMIADILSNKKINPLVTELFIRGRKHFSYFHFTILFCCTNKY